MYIIVKFKNKREEKIEEETKTTKRTFSKNNMNTSLHIQNNTARRGLLLKFWNL